MRLLGRGSSRRRQHQPEVQANDNNDRFFEQSEALIPAQVRMISGCHSEQTSADVSNAAAKHTLPNPAGRAGGACTSALLEILYQDRKITFQDLLLKLRKSLEHSGYDQIPQLTSSRPLDVKDVPFSMVGGKGCGRALLVGINYKNQSGELSGCHNDVLNMKQYITKVQGYPEQDVLVMMDDGRHWFPTRQKIIAALQQLVAQSKAGDSVYFHYSGHGGLLAPTFNVFKNNQNGYDETLYPLDHARAGQIRDFSLFHHFVKPMAAGVVVTCVMDCCHSGSVLDLPYSFRPTPRGTIMMRNSMDSLSNLAFLTILAGGMLHPGLFGNVSEYLDETVDGDLADYQGAGIDGEAENDLIEQDGGQELYGDTDAAEYGDDATRDFGDNTAYDTEYGEANGFGGDASGQDGYVVAGETLSDGNVANMGDYGNGGADYVPQDANYFGDGGVGDDVDCGGCGDILGALLDGADDF